MTVKHVSSTEKQGQTEDQRVKGADDLSTQSSKDKKTPKKSIKEESLQLPVLLQSFFEEDRRELKCEHCAMSDSSLKRPHQDQAIITTQLVRPPKVIE